MIYIPGINKDIWPLFVWPEENELFSSWICRFSNNNEIRSESISKIYFDNSINLWNRDIDVFAPKALLDYLENHTPLEKSQIENLFLTSYESIVFEKINPNGFTENILNLGIFHRKRKNYGIVFCPNCLKNNAYFKKEWRLFFSIYCETCKCKLLDRCPSCKKPISYHRNNFSKVNNSTSACKSLNICECNFNLSNSFINNEISEFELEFQNYINLTLKNGYNSHSQYSFLFFRGLSIIAYSIMRNNKKNKFCDYFKNELKFDFNVSSKRIIEWDIEERKQAYLMAYFLLSDWPNRILHICNDLKINKTDFYNLPYFIEKQILFR